jgi:hypothetical protein
MRFYVKNFAPDTKIVEDHEGQLNPVIFDNQEDANNLCEFLNMQEMEAIDARTKYKNLKYRLQKVIETF